jgi:hypothetical protein
MAYGMKKIVLKNLLDLFVWRKAIAKSTAGMKIIGVTIIAYMTVFHKVFQNSPSVSALT